MPFLLEAAQAKSVSMWSSQEDVQNCAKIFPIMFQVAFARGSREEAFFKLLIMNMLAPYSRVISSRGFGKEIAQSNLLIYPQDCEDACFVESA